MEKKIDVTSTALEKGLDMAKSFLDKLIMPAVEEVGLLVKDHVTMWRFNNQLRMVNKAKAYCDKNNINPKTISLKVLSPLLEYSGLEEDDGLQDKWAILLGNMVDSDQNIENHVFPYILSQISRNEYDLVEKAFQSKSLRITALTAELTQFVVEKPSLEIELRKKVADLKEQINIHKSYEHYAKRQELGQQLKNSEYDLSHLRYCESILKYKIAEPEELQSGNAQEYELSNLIRLGLVKEVREAYANSKTLKIPNEPDERYLEIELEIEVESNDTIVLTELGELFIKACTEKVNK